MKLANLPTFTAVGHRPLIAESRAGTEAHPEGPTHDRASQIATEKGEGRVTAQSDEGDEQQTGGQSCARADVRACFDYADTWAEEPVPPLTGWASEA
jgi:hypothetical protein